MIDRARAGLAAAGVITIGAVTTTFGVTSAVAAPSTDYPSWQDVQQAKGNERAAQAEVDRITDLLAKLQATADAAGRTSQIAAERALQAKADVDVAQRHLTVLQTTERASATRARTSRMRAGLLAAHLARGADGDLTAQMLLDSRHAGDLLSRLAAMAQLSVQSQAIYAAAAADDRTLSATRDQTAVAEAALAKRQAVADQAADAARATAAKAEAAVTAQQANQTRLVAQLADLQSTSTRVAAQYAAGIQHAKDEAAAKAAAAKAAGNGDGSGSGSGGSGGSGSSSGPVRAPNSALAASAVAFARDQIGDPYVFAGAGPNVWDCSGLTMQAYASVGIGIGGHSATAQYDLAQSQGQLVSYDDAQVGDLIFYTDGGGDMYHVAIYSGSGMMIEAPYEGVPVREVPVRSYQRMPVVARPTI